MPNEERTEAEKGQVPLEQSESSSESGVTPGAIEDEMALGDQDVEALRQQLEEEKAQAQSYLDNWRRAQADFINYRRRSEQEKGETARFANAMFILNLLPVLDDLERALGSVPRELAGFTWVDGVGLIYRKLMAMLEAQGLAEIKAEGQPFDPNLHEAVMFGEGEEGIVIAELQKGYRYYDRVIRPTLVKVGKSKEAPEGEGPPAGSPNQP